jgi:FRG domain
MAWVTSEVDRFEDFVRQIADILPTTTADDSLYWFRGQSNSDWNLEPSFLRSSGGLGLSIQGAVGLEREALKAFRSKTHLFVSPHLLEKVRTIPCWWALMQHHGAPSRLLDWTVSPYVAAYFAAQQDGAKKPGVVWCFCSRKLRETFEAGYGTLPDFASDRAPCWYKKKLEDLSEQQIVIPLTLLTPLVSESWPSRGDSRCALKYTNSTIVLSSRLVQSISEGS